jgi:hypothetical protein
MLQAGTTARSVPKAGGRLGKVGVCVSVVHQEGQCDLSLTSEGRMVEVRFERGAKL